MPIVRKMLTIEERKERMAKGLCINCDDSYFPGHKCKGKLFCMDASQRCLIEVVDQSSNDDQKEVAEDPVTTTEISLQAFSGTFNSTTIRLTGWVHDPASVSSDR